MKIFHIYTPYVQVVSIDEAYLDVTELVLAYGGAEILARQIKQDIQKETQLNCSIGIAANKLIAKIASAYAKPGGVLYVAAGKEIVFLAQLPVQAIPGVGAKTTEMFNREGIRIVADLQAMTMEGLVQRYGAHGYQLFFACRGQDDRPVRCEDRVPKSIGAERTFEKDSREPEFLMRKLRELVEKACTRMLRYEMRARGVTLKLRFKDFSTITRSHRMISHTNDSDIIFQEVLFLFNKNYQRGVELRLLGISLEKLTEGYWQPTLWDRL